MFNPLERFKKFNSLEQAHPIVQEQVTHAVRVLRRVPQVQEVRLFGSGRTPLWKSHGSDIDLGVTIRGDDPEWSFFTPGRIFTGWGEEGEPLMDNVLGAAPKRVKLDRLVTRDTRIELHMATEADLVRIKQHGYPPSRGFLLEAKLNGVPEGLATRLFTQYKRTFPGVIQKGLLVYENKK